METPDSGSESRTPTAVRLTVFAVIGLAILGLVAVLAWGLTRKEPVTGLSGETRVGLPAPHFTIELLEGGTMTLSELEGPVVVNFWASWCAPCWEEAPGLERAWRRFMPDGVTFVGINVQDSEAAARDYIDDLGVSYPNGRDEDGAITVNYGVVGLPVTFFIGSGGIVERRWVGNIPESTVSSWVEDLLAGAPSPGDSDGSTPGGVRPLQ